MLSLPKSRHMSPATASLSNSLAKLAQHSFAVEGLAFSFELTTPTPTHNGQVQCFKIEVNGASALIRIDKRLAGYLSELWLSNWEAGTKLPDFIKSMVCMGKFADFLEKSIGEIRITREKCSFQKAAQNLWIELYSDGKKFAIALRPDVAFSALINTAVPDLAVPGRMPVYLPWFVKLGTSRLPAAVLKLARAGDMLRVQKHRLGASAAHLHMQGIGTFDGQIAQTSFHLANLYRGGSMNGPETDDDFMLEDDEGLWPEGRDNDVERVDTTDFSDNADDCGDLAGGAGVPLDEISRPEGKDKASDESPVDPYLTGDLLGVVPVTVEFVLASSRMGLSEVAQLRPGSVVELNCGLSDRVNVRVNGITMGAGYLYQIGDQVGLRLESWRGG